MYFFLVFIFIFLKGPKGVKADMHRAAVAFSYFETLLRIGDRQKFLEEETRLNSLQNTLKDIGFQEHLYEDFVDETLSLLRETAVASDNGAALLQVFNDYSRSQSIITFLKVGTYVSLLRMKNGRKSDKLQLITSAWIQGHPDDYAPYMDLPLVEYCKNRIEPAICEIEHVGISALVDVLVKPAGIAAEILYLDRSPGNEVTTYRFDPLDGNDMMLSDPPTFRLLYRP
jgi:ubiquitin thioesterase protein OTUB1